VGFVVDKVMLGQVFSEYFGFPCKSSFHQLLHNHPHLSSRAGTIGQKLPQYKGLSSTPLAIIKKSNSASVATDTSSRGFRPDSDPADYQRTSFAYLQGRVLKDTTSSIPLLFFGKEKKGNRGRAAKLRGPMSGVP
jgi:hypothetical protein